MRDRPAGVSERQLSEALTGAWGIEVADLRYAPVGAGSYHWLVEDAHAGRWFVTVDDLDEKSWLPHPGNVLRTGHGLLLIDWDTVGLAVPERDLWLVPGAGAYGAQRRERAADPAALEFYRIRWALSDLAFFAGQLRVPHRRAAATDDAWQGLVATFATLAGHDGDPAGAVDRTGG